MYDTCCGKALIFRSWWCACDVCGRRYVHASNGALVQTSRPTKYALDAALVAPSEPDSSLDIIPANVAGSQPRQ